MFINAQFIAAPHSILEAEHQLNAGIAEPVKGSYTPKASLQLEDSHQCLALVPSANEASQDVVIS